MTTLHRPGSVPPADRIELRGLRAHGFHGVLPQEREQGQPFVVDVTLWLDARPAASSDDLADTVDYGDLAGRVAAVVTGEPVALLETLATRVAEECLADERVSQVEVTVHKPEAPLEVAFDDVAVTLVRRR